MAQSNRPPVPRNASASHGIVEGRVFSETSGNYLTNARVIIDQGNLETFTDAFGRYRFPDVSAGDVRIRVFYTGFPELERSVTVKAGGRSEGDFVFGQGGDGTVVLNAFTVAAARDMSAAALAVNEQRFSQNIKTVVATDSFGDIADGNVGEFVKFLPGISLGFTGGHASSISVGGLPPDSTPISIDGNRVASASGETRAVQLDQISINNMSRVEVVRSQTPDNPASGIGGSINLIPKSAFERRTPVYTVKTYGVFRDHALKSGPYSIKPNFEVTGIIPLNSRFGIALNITDSEMQSAQYATTPTWMPTQQAVTAAYPAANPSTPYLARYEFGDSPKATIRSSGSLLADWKISENSVLTAGLQYGFFNEQLHSLPRVRVIINPGQVVNWGPDFTQGATGAGSAQLLHSTRDVQGTTYQPNLRWRHNGPVWNFEMGGAFSRSTYRDRNIDKGYWEQADSYIRDLTVRFDHHGYLRPGGITVTDTTGRPVDTFTLDKYLLETARIAPVDRFDIVRSLNGHARREVDIFVPIDFKLGFDYSSQTRDLRSGATTRNYVGRDRVFRSPNNGISQWADPSFLDRIPQWGLSAQEGMNTKEPYNTFVSDPDSYQLTTAQEVAGFRALVNGSKKMTEGIYASYLRFDIKSLLDRRLTITGGARFEQTDFNGVGPSINPGAIYQRDAAGNIVRNSAGAAVVIAPLATMAGTRLAYVDRGARTERNYGDLYPSLSISYNFRPDLIGRLSYAKSITRPNFNHILPSLSLPDETATSRTITLTNPNLNPWQADSYGLALEYYFSEKSAGLLSARGYLREISDFWGATSVPLSEEIVDTYGLDSDIYSADRGYVVNTRYNVGDARVSGLELDYRQNLTFLPRWAEGLAIFANMTMLHLEGSATADFTGFVQKTINYGVTFNRSRFTARVNINERGRERRAAFTGAGVEPGTHTWLAPLKTVNVSTEVRLTKRIAVYGTVRNLFNKPEDIQQYGPSTPDYAKLRQRTDFRPLITAGLRGTF